CMIKSAESKTLGFTGDANMKEWPNAVKKVKAKYGSAKLVIPHHGNWGGQKLIDHTLELFEK
ncbi:MAG: MBL fold metallo-hydrolase, partial [Rhodothermaceae bacterium]